VAANAKNLTLTLHWEPDVPEHIKSDPVRLMQILNNVIGNAIKFTAEGAVTVRVSLPSATSPLLSAKPFICFEIHDTGVGMSDHQLAQLFTPFTQADNSITRLFGGTGLGLAISRSLCHLLEGHLQIDSEKQRGTLVRVLLPLQRLSPVQVRLHPVDSDDALARLRGSQVLLVEDHPMNRQLLQALMGKLGIQTIIAENGQQALECLAKSPESFDAVLMDVQMPVMDGIQATQRIREDARFANLPIIAVTANAMSDERALCLQAGMQDYLSKPVNLQALHEVLLRWI
jgi:CheY-like chemotaxis protein